MVMKLMFEKRSPEDFLLCFSGCSSRFDLPCFLETSEIGAV